MTAGYALKLHLIDIKLEYLNTICMFLQQQ